MLKKRITALIIVLGMVCLMAACGGGSASSTLEGTSWTLSSVKVATGETLSADDFKAMMGDLAVFEIAFKANGAASVNAFGESADGTYTQSGDKVSITIDGTAQEFKYDGETMSVENEGTTIILKKK